MKEFLFTILWILILIFFIQGSKDIDQATRAQIIAYYSTRDADGKRIYTHQSIADYFGIAKRSVGNIIKSGSVVNKRENYKGVRKTTPRDERVMNRIVR